MLQNKAFEKELNALGSKRQAFFFVIDFEGKEYFVDEKEVLFKLQNKKNYTEKALKKPLYLQPLHVSFSRYKTSFDRVIEHIKAGNTYLLNLTFSTKLQNSLDLEEIFYNSSAPFKLLLKNRFVCFSPEQFVCIKENTLQTYPMKGTIDASIVDAKAKILANKKEMSEHVMVVDLLRNDLGIVASDIKVEDFRYVQKINAGDKELLQVSSKISGKLQNSWHENIGTILAKLLPAGSISGTPKKMSLDIIKETENHERGFFTGVFGYYDGKSFNSAVMIRFIEKTQDGYVYKSGGGITLDSDVQCEYEEMKDKVYVPVF